jgi:DNA-binding XRE family transcriptional regulator
MSPISKTSFEDWQAEQLKDAEFVAAVYELEPGYQIARLRIQRGLTQTQLAEMVGTRQPSIARLENGNSIPSLSFLKRIADALNARIELRVIPEDAK